MNATAVTPSEKGKLYEQIVFLLFAERLYKSEQYKPFKFGREVQIGRDKKWDDIVIRFNDNSLILVQIKHKLDCKPITANILLSEVSKKGDTLCTEFNLQQYFTSYLNIKKTILEGKSKSKNIYQDDKIEHVIIFTSAKLDIEDLKSHKIELKEDTLPIYNLFDPHLSPPKQNIKTKCYQIKYEINSALYKIFKNSSDLTLLAKELNYYIKEEQKELKIDGGWIGYFQVQLLKEVIDVIKGQNQGKEIYTAKFTEKFVDNRELSGVAKALRASLFDLNSETDFQQKLHTKEWKACKKIFTTKKNIKARKDTQIFDSIDDNCIEDFFKRLVLVVDQPEVELLRLLVTNSLKETSLDENVVCKIKEMDTILVKNLEDLLKLENKSTVEIWPEDEAIVNYFEKLEKYITGICVSTCFSIGFLNKINNYKIKFKLSEEYKKLWDSLLNTGQLFNSTNYCILNIETLDPFLSSIKLANYFSNLELEHPDMIRLCMDMEELMNNKNLELIKGTFIPPKKTLLALICNAELKEKFIKDLLCDFESNSDYKVVFILQKDNKHALLEYLNKNPQLSFKSFQDNEIKFSNLDTESQKYLFTKKITFQNKKVKCLNDILNINGDLDKIDNLFCVKGLNQLVKLDENLNKLEFKTKYDMFLQKSLNTYTDIETEQLLKVHELYPDDIFLISGITMEDFKQIFEKPEEFTHGEYLDMIRIKPDTFKFLCKDSKEQHLSHFKLFCQEHQFKKRENIHFIKFRRNKFIWCSSYSHHLYVDRCLHPPIVKQDLIMNLYNTFIFVISSSVENRTHESLKEILQSVYKVPEDKISYYSEAHDANNGVLILNNGEEHVNFKSLLSKEVCWLEMTENKQLIWKGSKMPLGSFKNKYYEQTNEELYDLLKEEDSNEIINKYATEKIHESEFANLTDKIIVIADDPGMGKSTLSTNLLNHSHKLLWNIKIDFASNFKLDELDFDVSDDAKIDNFINVFLSKSVFTEGQEIYKNIFHYQLKNEQDVILWCDSFDELKSKAQDKMIKVFKFLSDDKNVKLRFTCKSHASKKLSDAFNVAPYKFKTFTKEDNDIFLERYWATVRRIPQLADLDEETFNTHFHSKIKLNSSPLIIRMFSELFIQNKVKLKENIYKEFIKYKYNTYFKKKEIIDKDVKKRLSLCYDKDHQLLALFKLFTESETIQDYYFLDLKKDSLLKKNDLKSIGIATYSDNNQGYNFIHKNYSDYFVANLMKSWILKFTKFFNLQKFKFLINVILLKDFQGLRFLFNNIVHNMEQEGILLNKNIKDYLIPLKLNNVQRTEEGQTFLHKAARENNLKIVWYILGILKYHPVLMIDLITARDYVGRTPFYIALQHNNFDISSLFYNIIRKKEHLEALLLSTFFIFESKEIQNMNISNLYNKSSKLEDLYDTIKTKWEEIILGQVILNKLWKKHKNYNLTNYAVLSRDKYLNTVLHRSIIMKKYEMGRKFINYLLQYKKSKLEEFLLARNIDYCTFLHLMVVQQKTKNFEDIYALIKKEEDTVLKLILAKDIVNLTVLHLAVLNNDFDAALYLLTLVQKLDGSWNCLFKFITSVNSLGQTFIDLAFEHKKYDFINNIMKFFIPDIIEINNSHRAEWLVNKLEEIKLEQK